MQIKYTQHKQNSLEILTDSSKKHEKVCSSEKNLQTTISENAKEI